MKGSTTQTDHHLMVYGFYDDGDPVVIKTEILGMAIQGLLNAFVDPAPPAEKTPDVLFVDLVEVLRFLAIRLQERVEID